MSDDKSTGHDQHDAAVPLLYDPAFETPEKDENDTAREMVETMHKISSIVHKDEGHAFRSVHAKSHGLLFATMTVSDTLPAMLAQGAFAKPGKYSVAMRFSTVPGDLLDDNVSTPRGLAIKIVGVEGERIAGTEGHKTQDFLMVNGPVFGSPTAKKFLANLKLLAATTDKAPGLKKAFSAVLQGVEAAVEKLGGESPTIVSMGGHPETNILGETFFTQVPVLFGPYMAKLSIVPVSPELTALTKAPVDMKDRPNALREETVKHFSANGGTWELRVQLCTDLDTMPIEDASVRWPEEQSPFVTVATIRAEPQTAWSEARSVAVDDGLSFSPWHSLAAHRPIGSIMRVRKAAYEMAAKFRSEHNSKKTSEPETLDGLPE